MAITKERLQRVFSEGGAQEIYREVKAEGDFFGFTRRYVFDPDDRVVRNALWGLTKANNDELSQLQVMLDELVNLAMKTENSSVRRLTLNIIERLEMDEEEMCTDFLDFCLEHMTSPKELPGIQSICMKLAFRMCGFYPELMEEFRRSIEDMDMACYKPAVRSLSNKILSGKAIGRQKTKKRK